MELQIPAVAEGAKEPTKKVLRSEENYGPKKDSLIEGGLRLLVFRKT